MREDTEEEEEIREGTSLCPESRVEIELVTRGDSFRGNKFSSLFGALIILGLVWGCKILDEGDGEGLGGAACSTVVYVLEGRVLIISEYESLAKEGVDEEVFSAGALDASGGEVSVFWRVKLSDTENSIHLGVESNKLRELSLQLFAKLLPKVESI